MKGKETILQFMIDVYSSIEIKDYKVAVNLAVTGKNGDEWVLLWDNGTILSEDGTSASFRWMESFRFENGKIVESIENRLVMFKTNNTSLGSNS